MHPTRSAGCLFRILRQRYSPCGSSLQSSERGDHRVIGKSLGPYEILEQLGAGGMGEVYLAEDTRLGRKVAVKVLPAEFASDPERRARFEQEARAAAALNHPHIAAVFDVGAEGNTHYMVQEFLEGQSLGDRLAGGALRLEEALKLAAEIGEALAAAHRVGIVHRDLKPDNVFVTLDGHAKVLDFGLAKLVEMSSFETEPSAGMSMSPTMLGTVVGQVMGTAGYMAPEQVNGEEVDRRADLFAFGCVLYQMASGQQPFAGRTLHHTLDRILRDEPTPVRELAPETPAQLQWILTKCLAKMPARRYQHAEDLVVDLVALGSAIEAGDENAARPHAPAPAEPTVVARKTAALTWGLAAIATVAAALAAWGWLGRAALPDVTGRYELSLNPIKRADELVLYEVNGRSVAIAPDGSRIVFTAHGQSQRSQLYERRTDSFEVRTIPGTEGGDMPFFSPDSLSVGFFSGPELKVLRLDGVSASVLAGNVGANVRGGTWGPDGTIVIGHSDDAGPTNGLMIVPAIGGDGEILVADGRPTFSYRYPQILPGGDTVLFTVESAQTGSGSDKELAVYSIATGETTKLSQRGTHARYLPSGHLVYARDDSLLAVPFDVDRLQALGPETIVLDSLQVSSNLGFAQFAVSDTGTLVYADSHKDSSRGWLAWADRNGAVMTITDERHNYQMPRLSPDGRRVALWVTEARRDDIWLYDLQRGALDRITTANSNWMGSWSVDGSRIVFGASRDDRWGVWSRSFDASGSDEPLAVGVDAPINTIALHPDGKTRAVVIDRQILVYTDGDAEAVPFFETTAQMFAPTFSPDGRWLAYISDELGETRLYVQAFPSARNRLVIPGDGAVEPVWSRDGNELYYRVGDQMMAVAFDSDADPPDSAPIKLFDMELPFGWSGNPNYDVSADGRFLVAAGDQLGAVTELKLVVNWVQELERTVTGIDR